MSEEPGNNLGGQVGARLAQLIGAALVSTKQRMAPHTASVAQTVLADFTNHVSDEVRSVMGPIFRSLHDHPDTPTEVKPLLNALGNLRGQGWAWIGGQAAGAAMGAGIGDLLTNYLAPAIQPLMAAQPNSLLTPETAAQVEAHNFLLFGRDGATRDEAAKSGMGAGRFSALVELNRALPTHQEVQDMVNRGLIGAGDAQALFRRMGYKAEHAEDLTRLREQLMSAESLAQMWNRDIVSMAEGERLANAVGVSDENFRRLTELFGDPLPPSDLAVAFRRGFIDRERFERGIVQGPLRKEWFDVLAELQFSRMSTIDAASAVTQGHMTLEQGKRVAHENGLDPSDFATLIEISGRPPGLDFALDMLNRGEISRAEFRTMFLESSIKNRYIDLMERSRIRLIPQETARLLYRNGVYTETQALTTLQKHGFSTEDSAALLALERTRADDNTKELTRAQVVDMYEERLLSLTDAVTMLLDLGYSENDARSMMELADLQRLRKFINSAIGKIKSAYVAGRMDEIEASALLDTFGIPNEQRDDMLALWDIERTTISKTLTAAQVRQAFSKGLINEADAMARLTAQGYDDVDAGLFLRLSA